MFSELLSHSVREECCPDYADTGPLKGLEWYEDAVVYSLEVRTFFDANGDGVGDFDGLAARLDYVRDLGVTCLLLDPFVAEDPSCPGGVVDHRRIDPSCGTMRNFSAFLAAAHRRDIRVLQRFVTDRTSRRHPWFEASRTAPNDSSVRRCYRWHDTPDCGSRPVGDECGLGWDTQALAFYCHGAVPGHPLLNLSSPWVQHALLSSMRFWLDAGVDGIVVSSDARSCGVGERGRDDRRLRDFLNQMCIRSCDGREWDRLFALTDGTPVPLARAPRLAGRATLRRRLASALLSGLSHADATPVIALLAVPPDAEAREPGPTADDPPGRLQSRVPQNFDTRALDLVNGVAFSLPGPTVISYGDEFGLGASPAAGEARRFQPLMPWSDDRCGGFSRSRPDRLWVPADERPDLGYRVLNVRSQLAAADSPLNSSKRWLMLRAGSAALRRGSLVPIGTGARPVLAYLRHEGGETVLIVANLSHLASSATIPLPHLAGARIREMTAGVDWPPLDGRPFHIALSPFACYWLQLLPSKQTPEERRS
jgi:maltose alpha-D-glucosyltransferase / alpha-amylase